MTSDDHEGLKSALKTAFPVTSWQRCQAHLQKNARDHVPRIAMRAAVAQSIRDIFDAPDCETAEAPAHQQHE